MGGREVSLNIAAKASMLDVRHVWASEGVIKIKRHSCTGVKLRFIAPGNTSERCSR